LSVLVLEAESTSPVFILLGDIWSYPTLHIVFILDRKGTPYNPSSDDMSKQHISRLLFPILYIEIHHFWVEGVFKNRDER